MSDQGQWLFIEAEDVWMFRDSKPFTAQQNFVARSQFPPNPQTMQGVIRTAYLESQNVNWQDYAAGAERQVLYEAIGRPQSGEQRASMGTLRITGPFLANAVGNETKMLVRVPLDLLKEKETDNMVFLKPASDSAFNTDVNFGRPLLPLKKHDAHEPEVVEVSGWLDETQFTAYLKECEITGTITKDRSLFEYEDRIGLGLNYSRRAAEQSLLYRARFIRPHEGVGLLVHINQTLFGEQGFVRIGGESRSGRFRVVQRPTPPVFNQLAVGKDRIKLVLLTPAYFHDGWQPAEEKHKWSPWVGERAELVSVALGKPLAISGWDVARKRSKPLRHYVPAGSVYYFENAVFNGTPFTQTPATDAEPDFGAMGFGVVAVGTW